MSEQKEKVWGVKVNSDKFPYLDSFKEKLGVSSREDMINKLICIYETLDGIEKEEGQTVEDMIQNIENNVILEKAKQQAPEFKTHIEALEQMMNSTILTVKNIAETAKSMNTFTEQKYEEKINSQRKDIGKLNEQKNKLINDKKDLETKFKKANNESTDYFIKNRELEEQMQEWKTNKENEDLKNKEILELKDAALSEANKKIDNLKYLKGELNSKLEEIEQYKNKINELNQTVQQKDYEVKNKDMQIESEDLKNKEILELKDAALSESNKNINDLKQLIDELNSKLKKSEQYKNKVNELNQEVQQKGYELKSKDIQIENTNQQAQFFKDQFETTKTEYRQGLADLKEETNKTIDNLKLNHKQEIEKLEEKINIENEERVEAEKRSNKAIQEVVKLNASIDNLKNNHEQKVKKLIDQLNMENEERMKMEKRINEFNEKYKE